MTNSRTLEIMVGLFVALGMAALFMLALQVSNLTMAGESASYTINARFDNVGGLKTRAPVTLGGVRIGRITAIDYDQERYEAVVALAINAHYNRLPKDSSASIFTAGLLGEQYIALEPGGDERYLAEGDEIRLTQPALVLEQVIGQFLFSKAQEGGVQ
jgi:phospholipid/cholesterol/gamma-HCH transport system substrate-binding protein